MHKLSKFVDYIEIKKSTHGQKVMKKYRKKSTKQKM